MEGLQRYGSDSSGDAAPAAPAATAMGVEVLTMVDMGRAASRSAARGLRPLLADSPLQ
jgi:hypothetical protein